MKCLIVGGTGFVGKAISRKLKDEYSLFSVGSKDYDLLNLANAEKMFQEIMPEIVIHAAGKTGGILANKSYPAEFWYQNMLLTAHIWELSKKYSVSKLIFIMPGCSFPKECPQPMRENSLFSGFPDIHPSPGALARATGVLASYAYRQEYGLKSYVLIPANLFGPHDRFEEYHSHVIPALILKMYQAKKTNTKDITLWGTGEAFRDFLFIEDMASLIPFFIKNDINFEGEPWLENVCNISTGQGTSIKQLAEITAKVIGFDGKINWDSSKPSGPLKKVFDNSRMKSLGLSCDTTLEDGITKTYKWFIENQ